MVVTTYFSISWNMQRAPGTARKKLLGFLPGSCNRKNILKIVGCADSVGIVTRESNSCLEVLCSEVSAYVPCKQAVLH